MNNVKCYKCKKEIIIKDGYKLHPLDKPYVNLFFHLECYREFGGDFDSVNKYLQSNIKDVFDYISAKKSEKIHRN